MKHKILIFCSCLLLFISCKKEENKPASVNEQAVASQLKLSFAFKVGNRPYFKDTLYTLNGRTLKFRTVNFYVSNFELQGTDSVTKIPQSYLLVKPGKTDFVFPLKKQAYSKLSFAVGLDSVANHANPADYSPNHPLYFQNENMHWDWNTGYIFTKTEGWVDTTEAGNQFPVTNFSYHLGTMDVYRKLEFPKTITFSGDTALVKFEIDIEAYLKDVDFLQELETSSITPRDNYLAVKIANNSSLAFQIK